MPIQCLIGMVQICSYVHLANCLKKGGQNLKGIFRLPKQLQFEFSPGEFRHSEVWDESADTGLSLVLKKVQLKERWKWGGND